MLSNVTNFGWFTLTASSHSHIRWCEFSDSHELLRPILWSIVGSYFNRHSSKLTDLYQKTQLIVIGVTSGNITIQSFCGICTWRICSTFHLLNAGQWAMASEIKSGVCSFMNVKNLSRDGLLSWLIWQDVLMFCGGIYLFGIGVGIVVASGMLEGFDDADMCKWDIHAAFDKNLQKTASPMSKAWSHNRSISIISGFFVKVIRQI